MNDAERRRQELLEQTRALYNDRRTIPAVHPRYANIITCMESNKRISMKIQKAEHLESAFFCVH